MQFTTTTHPFPLLALLLLLGLALGHHHHHRPPRLPTPPPPSPLMHEGELPTFWLGAGYDAGGDAAATTWAVAGAADQAACAAYAAVALDCGRRPYVAVVGFGAGFCGARPFGVGACDGDGGGGDPDGNGSSSSRPLFDARDGAVVGVCVADLASLQGKECDGLSYQTWLRCAVYDGFC